MVYKITVLIVDGLLYVSLYDQSLYVGVQVSVYNSYVFLHRFCFITFALYVLIRNFNVFIFTFPPDYRLSAFDGIDVPRA